MSVWQHVDLIGGKRAATQKEKSVFRGRKIKKWFGNKNPFNEVDVGYDQEQEVHGDFCESGEVYPWAG